MILTSPPDYFERHFNPSAAILTAIWLGQWTSVTGRQKIYNFLDIQIIKQQWNK